MANYIKTEENYTIYQPDSVQHQVTNNDNIIIENIYNNEELASIDINQLEYDASQNLYTQNVLLAETLQIPFNIENNTIPIAMYDPRNPVNNVKTPINFIEGAWSLSNSIPCFVTNMINVEVDQKANSEFQASSPHDSDSGLGNESQDCNLSWLLNFKLDEIPALQVKYERHGDNEIHFFAWKTSDNNSDKIMSVEHPTHTPRQYTRRKNANIYNYEKLPLQYINGYDRQIEHANGNLENFEGFDASEQPFRYEGTRKPPFTYTELIEHALRERGALTVSGIYQWISEHFAYYKVNDDRWKNSVRHNLSINPHFRKGNKSVHGAGHLWTIAQKDDIKNTTAWKMKKQRMANFIQIANEEWQIQQRDQDVELANATASILPDVDYGQENHYQNAVQITQLQQHEPVQLEINNRVLTAVKPEIEIQYIIPVKNNTDFLCPVTKEEVAEECGLMNEELQISNDYLIADFNPADLGFDLSEAEIVTSDQLFSEDLCLQYAEVPMDHN